MNKLPFMPFYPQDFLADTAHLTTEEKGIYLLILCAMWHSDDATIPNDDKKLANIAGISRQKWKAERPLIMEFLTPVLGGLGLTQKRLRVERNKAGMISNMRQRNAKTRWDVKKNKFNGIADAKAYPSAGASTHANAYANAETRARPQSTNNLSTSQSLPDDGMPTADAAEAGATGPPAFPVSDALLNTKILKKAKGH